MLALYDIIVAMKLTPRRREFGPGWVVQSARLLRGTYRDAATQAQHIFEF